MYQTHTYLGLPKHYKFDGLFKHLILVVGFNSFSQCTMIYNAYQSKQIIAICALDLAHEKFDI